MSRTNWDSRWMALAQLIATWSKDRGRKVGAVIVGPDNEVRSTGFNGIPRGVKRFVQGVVLVIGFLAAFWFASIAHHLRKDHLARVSEEFARERENLRVNAERSKARAMKQAQKHIAREAKATHAKANFKVGAAFSGIIAIGALLMLTQFLTVGIIALSTAAGAPSRAAIRSSSARRVGLLQRV